MQESRPDILPPAALQIHRGGDKENVNTSLTMDPGRWHCRFDTHKFWENKYVPIRMANQNQQRTGISMNIQIFGTKKDFDSKKAERFFKERGIKYQFIDMKEKGMSRGEFLSVCQAVGGISNLIDEGGKDRDLLALLKHLSAEDRQEKIRFLSDCAIILAKSSSDTFFHFVLRCSASRSCTTGTAPSSSISSSYSHGAWRSA
mgnify:CR=1 FL=1